MKTREHFTAEEIRLIFSQTFRDSLKELVYSMKWQSSEDMPKNCSVIETFINAGIDPTLNDNCAIKWASEKGNTKLVEFLIKSGVDVTASNNYAINRAANYGYLEIVKLLKEAGADVNYAMESAANMGKTEVVKYLLDEGAKITDDVIMVAATNGRLEVLEILYAVKQERKTKNLV